MAAKRFRPRFEALEARENPAALPSFVPESITTAINLAEERHGTLQIIADKMDQPVSQYEIAWYKQLLPAMSDDSLFTVQQLAQYLKEIQQIAIDNPSLAASLTPVMAAVGTAEATAWSTVFYAEAYGVGYGAPNTDQRHPLPPVVPPPPVTTATPDGTTTTVSSDGTTTSTTPSGTTTTTTPDGTTTTTPTVPPTSPPPPASPPSTPLSPNDSSGLTGVFPDLNDSRWVTRVNGLRTLDLVVGTGTPVSTDTNTTISAYYTGWTTDGVSFDNNRSAARPLQAPLSGLIAGWQQGVPGMQPVGIRLLYIPQALAYQGAAGRPAGDLIFEIKLVSSP